MKVLNTEPFSSPEQNKKIQKIGNITEALLFLRQYPFIESSKLPKGDYIAGDKKMGSLPYLKEI